MIEITSRFPTFVNPQALESLLTSLEQAGNLSATNSSKLKRFNYSIIHKLTSAIFCLESLCSIAKSGSYVKGLTSTGPAAARAEFDDLFKLLFYQDGLFTSLISSLDVLSLKLNLMFNHPIRNISNCYFQSLANTLIARNRTGVIETYLNNIITSPWYNDTRPFRKSLVHRQEIDYTIHMEVIAGVPKYKHLLPDDPLVFPHTYALDREITVFCSDKVQHFVNAINDLDGLLITEIQSIRHVPF